MLNGGFTGRNDLLKISNFPFFRDQRLPRESFPFKKSMIAGDGIKKQNEIDWVVI